MAKARLRNVELAPLQLTRMWVEELHILGAESTRHDGNGMRLSRPEVLQNPEDPTEYAVRFRIWAGHARGEIDLTVAGMFRLSSADPSEAELRMVEFNAPAMLFGMARGVVSNLTALTSIGKLDLPSVNLAELIDRVP